jgi:DNA-binding Lrp family transcriptional regulator
MPIAFVLVNSELGKEENVLKKLKQVDEVKEANIVYGVYDIITKVKAATMQDLKDAINMKIRRMEFVRSTVTMIVMED